MKFVIVTGMSGAGKSTALRNFEDMGYFCVDNLPINLITKFADLVFAPQGEITKVAIGVDIRSGSRLDELDRVFSYLDENAFAYEIVFLDSSDRVLIHRYKETRRSHPLALNGGIEEGIAKERAELAFLRKRADYIIDTSRLLTKELRHELEKIFVNEKNYHNIFITIMSFGFKYGIPADADLVFDVRFLPNPYYVPELKQKTGNDKEVQDYVMDSEVSHTFDTKLMDMIDFLIPNYIAEGKNQLVIAVGCTGGKHRSVTMANRLYEYLEKKDEYGLKIEHRDVPRST